MPRGLTCRARSCQPPREVLRDLGGPPKSVSPGGVTTRLVQKPGWERTGCPHGRRLPGRARGFFSGAAAIGQRAPGQGQLCCRAASSSPPPLPVPLASCTWELLRITR